MPVNPKINHGTTIVAVKTETRIALAADKLMMAGAYPIQTNDEKIVKLAPKLYLSFAGDVATGMAMTAMLQHMVTDNKGEWRIPFEAYWMSLRAWTEGDEAAKKGIAKALLKKDAPQAVGIVIAPEGVFQIWSTGEFVEVSQPVYGQGCAGEFAEGAARALLETKLNAGASAIARQAVKIAAQSTVFANDKVTVVSVGREK